MRVAFVVGALLSLVPACGQEGVSIDTSEANMCAEIAEVFCHNAYYCCTESEIQDLLSVEEPRTEAQCREDAQIRCERLATPWRDSLENGRATLDTGRMNICLQALVAPDGTCSDLVPGLDRPWEEDCEESPIVGAVEVGGACLFDFDCIGWPDTADCAPNQKCVARPTQGFPCTSATPCAEGFYCSVGICQTRLGLGSPCMTTAQCQDELYCDTRQMPMPLCAAKVTGGEACTADAGCESGDCLLGTCMGTSVQCATDQDCGSRCSNNPNLTCTTAANCGNGTCQMAGTSCNGTSALCNSIPNDVCVFPASCLPSDCTGDAPVCTAAITSVLYCSGSSTSALSYLPIL